MKLTLTLFLISLTTFAQSKDSAIRDIKRQYSSIAELMEQGLLTEKTTLYSCEDQGLSGSLTYYFLNQELKIIVHTFDQGHHSSTNRYYVNNEKLFFYFLKENFDNDNHKYDPNTGDLIEIEENWSVFEKRIYIYNEKAIRCLEKEYGNNDIKDETVNKYPNISNHFKNQEMDCEDAETRKVLIFYDQLRKHHNNPCIVHK